MLWVPVADPVTERPARSTRVHLDPTGDQHHVGTHHVPQQVRDGIVHSGGDQRRHPRPCRVQPCPGQRASVDGLGGGGVRERRDDQRRGQVGHHPPVDGHRGRPEVEVDLQAGRRTHQRLAVGAPTAEVGAHRAIPRQVQLDVESLGRMERVQPRAGERQPRPVQARFDRRGQPVQPVQRQRQGRFGVGDQLELAAGLLGDLPVLAQPAGPFAAALRDHAVGGVDRVDQLLQLRAPSVPGVEDEHLGLQADRAADRQVVGGDEARRSEMGGDVVGVAQHTMVQHGRHGTTARAADRYRATASLVTVR